LRRYHAEYSRPSPLALGYYLLRYYLLRSAFLREPESTQDESYKAEESHFFGAKIDAALFVRDHNIPLEQIYALILSTVSFDSRISCIATCVTLQLFEAVTT
jgi:hypothetical protein